MLFVLGATALLACAGAGAASAPGGVPPNARAHAISAGGSHTCAVARGGLIECWGSNSAGQLGGETQKDRTFPVAVTGLPGASAIAAGGSFTCARTIAGELECWGDGQTPHTVASGVAGVAAGAAHACALTRAGGVECWGDNRFGQLGDGTRTRRAGPVGVSGLSGGVLAVTAGGGHTCALTSSGAVKCWGENEYGQLGDGSNTDRSVPVPVSGLTSGVAAIAAGGQHTCVVTRRGAVRCWGRNLAGQLGDGTTRTRIRPTALSALAHGVAEVAAGRNHTCALMRAGRVLCWGDDGYGQLGDGKRADRRLPAKVTKLSRGVVAIAAGASHTCALMRGGHVLCTGQNAHGQLGDGTKKGHRTSAAVVGFGAAVCTVPAVLGKTLARAKAAIARSHCRVGTVRRLASRRKANTVLGASPHAGTHLLKGARVGLVVSRGR
jgi:alpha-tubulin suppressor-like RCC1 family protein